MTSAAWEAMQMGLDPVCGPDGQPWEESIYKRPQRNIDIFGESDDGNTSGKYDMDGYGAGGWEGDESDEENAFDVARQTAIIEWLSSSRLAKNFKTREGFFVAKGSQVKLKDGITRDLFEWLTLEGIEGQMVIGSFSVAYSEPNSKYGERLSFFKDVIEAPFEPLSNKPGFEIDDDDIPF